MGDGIFPIEEQTNNQRFKQTYKTIKKTNNFNKQTIQPTSQPDIKTFKESNK
jgi:hypothetical protein